MSKIPILTPGGSHGAGAVPGVPCMAVVNLPPDKLCFPIDGWHANDFRHGGCAFGAPRPAKHGHRLHAGVDLLAPRGKALRALADGFVRQSAYYFYSGTNALEVVFPGVGVARYGEILMHQGPHFRAGQEVKAGQVVAHVGQLGSGHAMLHFELYQARSAGKDVADFDMGPLTQRSRHPYERHPNLVNPTQFMWALHQRVSAGK